MANVTHLWMIVVVVVVVVIIRCKLIAPSALIPPPHRHRHPPNPSPPHLGGCDGVYGLVLWQVRHQTLPPVPLHLRLVWCGGWVWVGKGRSLRCRVASATTAGVGEWASIRPSVRPSIRPSPPTHPPTVKSNHPSQPRQNRSTPAHPSAPLPPTHPTHTGM